MYIMKLKEETKNLINQFDNLTTNEKIDFILYVLDRFDNNQINSLNEANPNLLDDSIDIEIFNSFSIGYSNSLVFNIKESINIKTKIYRFYPKKHNQLSSLFEDLEFKEKVKVVAEGILFLEHNNLLPDYLDGYLIARNIIKYLS